MEATKLQLLADEKFKTPEASGIDVLYATADGQLFFTPEGAAEHASIIPEKDISPFYKDVSTRRMAEFNPKLLSIIQATDWVKAAKAVNAKATYESYEKYTKKYEIIKVSKDLFDFILDKVFSTRQPSIPGQMGKIYMFDHGFVDAVFLKRYPQGQIWQWGDTLVFTCPTNTELMSGSYRFIFSSMFQ